MGTLGLAPRFSVCRTDVFAAGPRAPVGIWSGNRDLNSDDRVPSAADYQIIPFPDGGSDECCPRTSALTEPCAVCYTTEPYVVVPYQIHGVGLEPTISPQSGANAGYRPAALAAMLPVGKWSARCESNARGLLQPTALSGRRFYRSATRRKLVEAERFKLSSAGCRPAVLSFSLRPRKAATANRTQV